MAVEHPIRLTDAVRELLVKAASEFMPYDDQARYARIGPRTYRRWRARARAGEEPFASLMVDVHRAEADAQMALQGIITHAAKGRKKVDAETGKELDEYEIKPNWLAAAWSLERRKPHEYGMSPGLRPELQEEDDSTSAASRKEALLQAYRVTRGESG